MSGRMYSRQGKYKDRGASDDPLVQMAYAVYIERMDTLDSMKSYTFKSTHGESVNSPTVVLYHYLELENYLIWLYTTNFTEKQWVEYIHITCFKADEND